MEAKIKNLIEFCQGMYRQENGKELYDRYLQDIDRVNPKDVFLVMNELLKAGISPSEVLVFLDKIINVFYKSLDSYQWERPKEDSFLYYLMQENSALLTELEAFKEITKCKDLDKSKSMGLLLLDNLNQYNDHLLKLENILFPYLEKKNDRYNGLKIMWALHDRIRQDIKNARALLGDTKTTKDTLNKSLGSLYFDLHALVQKQELIMLPVATKLLTESELNAMHIQSFDFDFAYIDRPAKPNVRLRDISPDIAGTAVFRTETGNMTYEQLELLINALPVDVTYVDEHDRVAFFSRPKDRIFPRTPAVIGRDVRNCHPPESVHVVESILDSFREGTRDSETFWIQLKGMFILIQYFALRDEQGVYKGTLEVSQDISEIKTLEGQKRLLD